MAKKLLEVITQQRFIILLVNSARAKRSEIGYKAFNLFKMDKYNLNVTPFLYISGNAYRQGIRISGCCQY